MTPEAKLLKQQTIDLMKRVLKRNVVNFEVSACLTEIHYFYIEYNRIKHNFISIEELDKLQWNK